MSALAALPAALPAATTTSTGLPFNLDPLTIGLVLLLVVMVIFMIRNSRKRRRDAEELKNKFVPGAEVMTQHGIYGTIISIDDEKNEAIIETTPGTRLRVHRQTIARVVDPVDIDPEKDIVAEEPEEPSGEPEYGERITGDTTEAPAATPAGTSAAASASVADAPVKPAPRRRTPAAGTSATTNSTASTTRAPRKKPASGE